MCLPLVWFASKRKWMRLGLDILAILPLVLPPTVLGYYIVYYLSPNSTIGEFLQSSLGWTPVFSFGGILLATVIYSFPFMVRSLIDGWKSIPENAFNMIKLNRFRLKQKLKYIFLPYLKPYIASGFIMSFAHAMGAFGVILMVGGNMPETRTASVAIYDSMMLMDYDMANTYALVLLGLSIALVVLVKLIQYRKND